MKTSFDVLDLAPGLAVAAPILRTPRKTDRDAEVGEANDSTPAGRGDAEARQDCKPR